MLDAQKEFTQQTRDEFLRNDLEQLVRLAIREDLDRGFDLTTIATVPTGLPAVAHINSRAAGVAAGIDLIEWIIETIGVKIEVEQHCTDGKPFLPGQLLATLRGDSRDVLTCERTILNFLGRLCGISSWTNRHVQIIAGLKAKLYDTRKTTPGWRRLEKYAVQCGGGCNHRGGLYDAVLIKDNHLAAHYRTTGTLLNPREAISLAKKFIASQLDISPQTIIEIEVDSLVQLADALTSEPDIVLLDNMSTDLLRQAVSMRDQATAKSGRYVQLEASGGVTLETLRSIAETGVDRISVGALTHSAINLDLGLDWEFGGSSSHE